MAWIVKREESRKTEEAPYVYCEKCKHLILREDAQFVPSTTVLGRIETIYFCPADNVRWTLRIAYGDIFEYKWSYFREVSCDENGKILKDK